MKSKFAIIIALLLSSPVIDARVAGKESCSSPVEYVSTMVGTMSKREFSTGNTYPAVAMPWGMNNPVKNRTIEYADNRISLYAAQYGRCYVTGKVMAPHDIHCHHKVPVSKGGTDEYTNLVLVCEEVHTLVHASQSPTTERILKFLSLEPKQLSRLNKLRTLAGMPPIIL